MLACLHGQLRGSDELSAALARLGTSTLDKDPKFRAGIAKLWDLAVSLQLLAPSDLVKELGVVAPSLDDTAVDVPKIAAYFAEVRGGPVATLGAWVGSEGPHMGELGGG
jgi:hypothetical protein